MIAGHNDLMCELIRFDHNPTSGHCNNIKSNSFIRQEPKVIHGTHCHFVNEKFNVVYPKAPNHAEALQVNEVANAHTFAQCLMAIKYSINIHDGQPALFDSIKSDEPVVSKLDQVPEYKLGSNFEQRLWRNVAKVDKKKNETKNISASIVAQGDNIDNIYSTIFNKLNGTQTLEMG